jgi:hypothetical protein
LDWGESLLPNGTVGIGMFPAKFTFDATATPSCASDYVAFNTSQPGVAPATAAIQGGNRFIIGAAGIPVGTFTITHGALALILTAAPDNTGNNFLVVDNAGTGSTTNAASLAAQITALGGPVGVTAMSAGPIVNLTARNIGIEGNSITVATDLTNFMLGGSFNSGVGTGNIVAFNNLYASEGGSLPAGLCGSNGPSVYWSYYTGAGSAVTSIVLSLDGSKVAFVDTTPGVAGVATLRILQWKALEGAGTGYPVAPTTTLPAGTSWAVGCPPGTSCLSSIPFSGPAADTKSSPFYVYGNNADVLYVGDDNGSVHKFTGVFNGTPAEVVITGVWPMPVNAGAILTSPIFDSISGNIYVGDSTGRLSFIQEVGSTVGGVTPCSPLPCLNTVNLAVGTAGAIVDAPIVDGTNGTVFAVNGTDTLRSGTILQASTALTGAVSFRLGGLSLGSPIYSGAFDNTYFTSSPGAIAGHMYICGKDPLSNDRPAIYQLNFNAAGVLQNVGATRLAGLASNDGAACSPVTEFFNPNAAGGAKDWIFFSIGDFASGGTIPPGGCQTNGAGCVISVDVTNPAAAWPPTSLANTAPVPGRNTGSTSGIVVDNQADTAVGVFPQASSLYFTLSGNSAGTGPGVPSCNTTPTVGCAIKLTQSGLN